MTARAFAVDDKLSLSGGTMTGTLTLDGAPPLVIPSGATTGTVPVSSGSGALTQQGVFGTRPEWFGTITGVSGDDAAINDAIAAVAAGASGCPGPVVISQPCAIDGTVTAVPGVNMAFTGQGGRVAFPDTFVGGYIQPSALFSTSGVPLITIGASGTQSANPNGMRLFEPCLSGMTPGGTLVANCVGMLITDTADTHLLGGFLANFDRTGGTGTCVKLASSSGGVGFETHGTIFSSSWQGLYGDGAGVTDIRLVGGLYHSCTQNISLGTATGGGGGLQMTGVHLTYSGMPSGGWHLSLGSAAGDFNIAGCYFDQAGTAVPVQLATAKGRFSGNHFLAAAASAVSGLVKVTTAAQELNFNDNDVNVNGSTIKSLLWTSGHSGAPTCGTYSLNTAYGSGSSGLTGVLIDSALSAISATSSATTYVAGNVIGS